MSAKMYEGVCTACKEYKLVGPLHEEGGGPPHCIPCGIEWHATRTKRDRYATVFRVMADRLRDLGARKFDLDLWQICGASDTFGLLGSSVNDSDDDKLMNLELLEDCIRLTHPDKHPEERKAKAGEVTRMLVALRPYTLPKPNPKPKETKPRNTSVHVARDRDNKPLRSAYPCKTCQFEIPLYYCDKCKAEWEKRLIKERDRRRAKQREAYKRRKQMRNWRTAPKQCPACGDEFKGKRKDAKYCSAACRQRSHRERVTDKQTRTVPPLKSHNRAAA